MLQEFLEERKRMVERQLRGRGIIDVRVLAAFESIPRHLFVPEESQPWAYEDRLIRSVSGRRSHSLTLLHI